MLIACVARSRMGIHKLELNFADFCKYSFISEMNFPKQKHIKISVKSSTFVGSINYENTHFLYFRELLFKTVEES